MLNSVNRRAFLIGTGASVLAMAAAGPARADTPLRFAWWGGQSRAERTQKVVELFTSKNPGVTVSTEYLGWGDYWPKLTTEVSGGNAPDLIQMSSDYLADYASRGVLHPLDGLTPAPLDIGDFDPKLRSSGKIGGVQYAVPSGVNAVSLIVNKAAFDEAGIAAPGHDTTWEGFAKDMAAFTKATKRSGMYGSPDGSGMGPVLETWLRQRGAALYTAEGALGFDAGDLSDWFQMWSDMRASGAIVPPDVQALDHGDIDNSLMSIGKTALAFMNSNQYVGVQALVKDPLTLAPYPRVAAGSTGGLYVKPTMFYSLSAKSKDVTTAASLLNFILRDPEATAILGFERGIPASAAAMKALSSSADPASQLMVDYVAGLGDLAGELPPNEPPGGGEVLDALTKAAEEVAFGTKDAKTGATDFVAAAGSILSRAG
jgi:multiple sugar transport system substrate-binding protein